MKIVRIFQKLSWLIILLIILEACSFKKNDIQEQSSSSESEKPNVIIFFTDDQGYADVGVFGAQGFQTPNLDQLANDGIMLTNFYVPATVCTPSRAALLTGKYPKRLNLHEGVISPYSTHGLAPKEYTLAEMLRDNGYSTSIIGKWHLGHHDKKFMPNNQGFDSYYGVPYSNDMDSHYYKHNDFQSPPLPFYRNHDLIGEGLDQSRLTTMYTEEAVSQIKNRDKNKPFFMYLAQSMPHLPLFVSKKFDGKSELGLYGDVIMEIDWSAGEMIKALKEEKIFQNTIFIFTSDNGPRVGSAQPLRGIKAQTWEGGQRVPTIISWPKVINKESKSDEVLSTLDLFPTIANIVKAKLPEDFITDGRNVLKVLENPETFQLEERPFYYYGRNGDLEAIRQGKWKLHRSKTLGWNKKQMGDFEMALYNLDEDISETTNVATDHHDIVQLLLNKLQSFDAQLSNN